MLCSRIHRQKDRKAERERERDRERDSDVPPERQRSAALEEGISREGDRRPIDSGNKPLYNGRERINGGFPFPEWSTPGPSMDSPVTQVSEKDNSWLYTLDPILVTIIVMSSLGVLLGAVCGGLLLYCTCFYSGLSSRSSTTLENYNFELYDGIKHKVKINQQRCCSEA